MNTGKATDTPPQPLLLGLASTDVLGPLAPTAWKWVNSETAGCGYLPTPHGNPIFAHLYSWTPLYQLTPEDIAAVNAARKAKAWAKRDLKCGCDHSESCLRCYPAEMRPGGVWGGPNVRGEPTKEAAP